MGLVPFVVYSLLLILQSVTAKFTWPFHSFDSAPFQPPKLDIVKTNEAPTPGLLFLGPKGSHLPDVLPNGGSTAVIYDPDGNLVWHGPDVETANLQAQTLFGKPVLTYWSGKKVNGYGYGVVHILDQSYNEIHTVTLQGDYVTSSGAPENSYIDLHESKITERNTILVTSYNLTQIDTTSIGGLPDTWTLKSAFHEIEITTNKVLFSWSPLDHLQKIPLTASRSELRPAKRDRNQPWDIHHINSVDDAAAGYVISLRHTFTAAYVNRDGSILWCLDGQNGGDFDLCQTCRFSWQHHMNVFGETVDGLNLTIFNNDGREGPDTGRPTSGLVLGVNVKTMTVTNERMLVDPNESINADTQGSLQALGGNTTGNMLVGYGSWATVKEFNAKGNIVWTARFGPDAQIASYRSFKFDWHAVPSYPPSTKVVAYRSPMMHRSTHVYVSWNGATDLARWNFFAQAAHDAEPIMIGSKPKTEFETSLIVDGYLDGISVEPILLNGTTLPRFPAQRTELHGEWTDANGTLPRVDNPSDIAPHIVDPAPVATLQDDKDKDSKGPQKDFVLEDEHDEETVEIAYSDTSANYEWPLLLEAAFISFFFVVCLLGASICLRRRWSRWRKEAWYEWIPGATKV